MKAIKLGAGILGLALLAAGCGPSHHANGSPKVKVMDGADRLPTQTASDWVSYADHVVIYHVDSEAVVPPDPSETNITKYGEGYIARTVKVTVQKTIWSRPGADDIPATLTLDAAGWFLKDGQRREVVIRGDPRGEVGHTYAQPLAHLADGSWAGLGVGTTLPIDDGIIGHGETKGGWSTPPNDVVARVRDRTASDITAILKAATPDPNAVKYSDLDPEARYHKLAELKRTH